ncbi:MAG: Nudix family hydrolase [Methylophilaceae bacterium]
MNATKIINAAVAVLIREDGQVLLGKRPEGKPWAGWWEFPGGKMEAGETALEALQRELEEELGTHAVEAYPWLTRTFAYPEKTVKLHFFMVRRWIQEPHGREGQELSWQDPAKLSVAPMLPANEPILAALSLPSVYAITNLAEMGESAFFRQMESALDAGVKLIQIREKQLDQAALKHFSQRVLALAKPRQARVFINDDIELARELGADGVHLSSQQLMHLKHKPAGLLCSASCHNAGELQRAQNLTLDFAVLSPVLPTASHAGATTLGWPEFTRIIEDCAIPVYALGGLQPQDLTRAWQSGAHGVAMQRAVWQ